MCSDDSSSLSLAAKTRPLELWRSPPPVSVGKCSWQPFLHVRHHSLLPPERARSRLPLLLQPPVRKKVPRKKCFPNLHATSNFPGLFSLGGGDSEKPQGVRVLRGGPMTIVIHPTGGEATMEVPRPAPATCERGPTFASLADERAADDLGVLLMGGEGSRVNSPSNAKRRPLSLRRSSRTSSADSRSRKSAAVHPVTIIAGFKRWGLQLKMPSRAFEVDIKLEKPSKDATAGSPNQLADRAYMFDSTGEKENSIRCYKHTISSLIASRIGDMNRESRMLQESECKRKGAHRPRRAPPAAGKTTAPGGSTRCMYDSISKQVMRKPRQFSFH